MASHGIAWVPSLVKINKRQTAFVPLQAPHTHTHPTCLPRTHAVYITSTPPPRLLVSIHPTSHSPLRSPAQQHPPAFLLYFPPSSRRPRCSWWWLLLRCLLLLWFAMAVHARFLSHAFPPDLQAFRSMEGGAATGGSSLFLDEHVGCPPAVAGVWNNTVLSDLPRSELTCNDNYGFVPRKRARAAAEEPAAGLVDCAPQQQQQLQHQRVALQQAAAMHGLVLPSGVDAQSRAVGSAAASTSGRMGNAAAGLSQGILSQLYNQGVEMDALIRLESERMRTGLEEARRQHARAVLATIERAAAGRLRAVEAELERARYRNAELEERLRQMSAEGQAWLGVAKSHEAIAVGLRATLDQLLQSPCAIAGGAEGDAEDAQSCCFETPAGDNDDAASKAVGAASCKACGEAEACVLLLPCRHLSLCSSCEPVADTCPVCAATKNASLHVLLS